MRPDHVTGRGAGTVRHKRYHFYNFEHQCMTTKKYVLIRGIPHLKTLLVVVALAAVCLTTVSLAQNKKNASAWFQSGKEKVSNKDFYGAIDDFTMAIESKPDFAKAYYHRGLAYLRYNQKSKLRSKVYLEKARADLMKAKELGFAVDQKYLDESQ
jgi:tetratricopeptide (TPR) repeat protein